MSFLRNFTISYIVNGREYSETLLANDLFSAKKLFVEKHSESNLKINWCLDEKYNIKYFI